MRCANVSLLKICGSDKLHFLLLLICKTAPAPRPHRHFGASIAGEGGAQRGSEVERAACPRILRDNVYPARPPCYTVTASRRRLDQNRSRPASIAMIINQRYERTSYKGGTSLANQQSRAGDQMQNRAPPIDSKGIRRQEKDFL